MQVMVEGRFISVNDEQAQSSATFSTVMLLGMVTLLSEVHQAKAKSPMDVKDSGRLISDSDKHPSKA
jgi:hypothetical protein